MSELKSYFIDEIRGQDREAAVYFAAHVDAEIESLRQQLAEAGKWRDRYYRDVEGLNNEGDPIGGDPAWGMRQQLESLQNRLAEATAEVGRLEALRQQYLQGALSRDADINKVVREKRELEQQLAEARAEIQENEGVINVWRRRCQEAEARAGRVQDVEELTRYKAYFAHNVVMPAKDGDLVLFSDVQMLLSAPQPPAGGEEIMVNAAHDVYALPLKPSGLASGPRFVVHVPAPETPPAGGVGLDEYHIRLPKRPEPEAPAGTVGLEWDAYSGSQMIAYGRECADLSWQARAILAQPQQEVGQ